MFCAKVVFGKADQVDQRHRQEGHPVEGEAEAERLRQADQRQLGQRPRNEQAGRPGRQGRRGR
ncbi:hypothetical protein RLJV_23535 [Pseudomonas aeruginosa]|nr:hypothetical protein RLJV_23535 [Pseudomonas aeruginosa]